jgi:hypothetical protein
MERRPQPRLMEIHEKFEQTDFGKTLAGRVRYDRYRPTGVSNERWVELLGADVNNLTHLTLTYGLAQDFIRTAQTLQPDLLTSEDEQLLQVAALIHDWAESIVGDISFGDKTANDEIEEQEVFEANLASFYDGDITLINKARTEIVFDHTGKNKLGQVFNAIERVGYLRTALRAGDHIIQGDAMDCDDGLHWLVADVLSQQPKALTAYAETLQPVGQFLANQHDKISLMFEIIARSDDVFDNYPVEQREAKRLQFSESYQAWQQYRPM